MIITEDVYLEHFGIKGMRWGIRKNSTTSGNSQVATPNVNSTLHKSTQIAGKEIAAMIGERYDFHISAVNAIPPGHPEYATGTVGFVQHTPGQRGGVVYASHGDLRKMLKDAEDMGWFAEGTGNVQGFLTHESSHAIFHAEQQQKSGFLKVKTVGGNIEARDKALKSALQEAKKQGISNQQFSSKVSGYAAASGKREEIEAELFSQYHWSPNPPSFVKAWGETLHQEMGIDSTPFRESLVRHG